MNSPKQPSPVIYFIGCLVMAALIIVGVPVLLCLLCDPTQTITTH